VCGSNMQSATPAAQRLGATMALQLRNAIRPHFLRREKSTLGVSSPARAIASPSAASTTPSPLRTQHSSGTSLLNCRKNDFVVWLPLSQQQRRLYERIAAAYQAVHTCASCVCCLTRMSLSSPRKIARRCQQLIC
jgi:hypothetical protein